VGPRGGPRLRPDGSREDGAWRSRRATTLSTRTVARTVQDLGRDARKDSRTRIGRTDGRERERAKSTALGRRIPSPEPIRRRWL